MIEIEKTKDNEYYFRLTSESGQVLLKSVRFNDRKEVEEIFRDLNNIQNKQYAFERKTNHNGKFLFNLKAENGQLIGSSQLYSSEAGMENGIKNLKNSIKRLLSQE